LVELVLHVLLVGTMERLLHGLVVLLIERIELVHLHHDLLMIGVEEILHYHRVVQLSLWRLLLLELLS